MGFFIEMLLKLLFLFSIIPFLLSEKLQKKYDMRINPQVEYTIFSGPQKISRIEEDFIDETSGMVVSQKYPGHIFVHNDSDGAAEIYALDTLGNYLGSIRLDGVRNRDWEDLAIGPGPDAGESYLYIGDIGDNFSRYSELIIYRIPEPEALDPEEKLLVVPEKIVLKYPDGSKDAETMFIDPLTGHLYVLTKRDASNTLYKAAAPDLVDGNKVTLERVMDMPITLSVGGDISADGRQILIKNYWVVYYWNREPGESLEETLKQQPKLLPYEPEPQGEAIAFTPSGQAYFTLSEKKLRVEPVLYRYEKVLTPE
ncbi:hypothetical protein SAMN04488057_111128 [Cyclobacterium lianum]|uniref:Major royal jelly protein n=1 Tax=Cyclobacterium lianum TaxID=388280 RepID=A0A1M7PXA6_9BACT|nr:hypothetical protein [Cyclobacterium lianum]SHN22295.1 hypothetical protein SAMN04488057_111128 [Cyclobacterium lianum]